MARRKHAFDFKQFSVQQDRCAMKVGTDGILLGAWTEVEDCKQILDIGTGTGLIALMVAQRAPLAKIDAVEMDQDACNQAQENIERSPWCDRISVYSDRIQNFAQNCSQQYDLIICNPPYFVNSAPSPQRSRHIARHSDQLSQIELLEIALLLLKPQGKLSLIYPYNLAFKLIQQSAQLNLICDRLTLVKPTPHSQIKRSLIQLTASSITQSAVNLSTATVITIESQKHSYTEEFSTLVKDFYLYL
ncbi:MAG: methyltransferase [Pseudanabaenaceae cyanobacterium bins.39]|nr:methyltransferase [Pseudanabaenaceae cyanobacterium bins.39]